MLINHLKGQIYEEQALTETERQKILVEWNNTHRNYLQDQCIHQLFETQVEQTPEAVAVVFEQEQLTYQELNNQANQLAHYLQDLGVKPDELVGICVERSLEMIVGILGIFKAGGAYVPLDPDYPPERLGYILSDSQVSLLLTQRRLTKKLPEHKAQIIFLEQTEQAIAEYPPENLVNTVSTGNLAYVIYTSGSTGKPKGVMIEHGGLYNLAKSQIEIFGLGSHSRVLQFASLSFDASIWEIFMALGVGATLYLGTKDALLPGLKLIKRLHNYRITHVLLPPSALAVMPVEELPTLETIIVGGEACTADLVQKWATGRRFFNAYGPTETTVCATVNQCVPSDQKIPIGRPIANIQIYVLDQQLQPVPIGVAGELHIGGVGLARGYLHRPELTAEKFIPNPFDKSEIKSQKSKLYKTGDLARYLPDGKLEFLGRIDHQVKIAGFRIELGEIEAALRQHPQVEQAVVVAREDIPGDKRLIAYVVANSDLGKMSYRTVRDYLRQKLPDFMIPSALIQINALPLTPNGKIDRINLPVPANIRQELAENFVPPSTPTEQILSVIWGEVLGLQQIGINDNFFELGGNSLLAISIISRIQEAFSVELPLNYLFTTSTIALVAQEIENLSQGGSLDVFLPPLIPIHRDQPIPLSLSQQGLWEVLELNPNSCNHNCCFTLRLKGSISLKVLEQSINEIIRRHEILRTTFTVVDDEPVQIVTPFLTLPINIVNLQNLSQPERDDQVQRIFEQKARYDFNLAIGPLMDTTLLQLTPEESKLVITMQYLIIDGWSISIFLSELRTIYSAFSMGKPSPLPEPSVQYGDFTLWEQKWLNEDLIQKNLVYWQKKLANLPTPLTLLPTKQPGQNKKKGYASLYSLDLSESLGSAIKAFSLSQKVTYFVMILTVVKILLFKLSGQTEVIVVGTIANRRTPTIEKILGWFINDLYLYSHVDNTQTGMTLLEQVQQTLHEAITHQKVPIHRLYSQTDSLKFVQSVSISMTPPLPWQGEIFELEPISFVDQGELWAENTDPLELYILPPYKDSQKIKILGCYSTNLLTDETIEQFFSGFQKVIQQLVTKPEILISEFEI
ncbi:amino acid adenylation domain-containing protein [Dolichospermum sp. LEGE 00240]|uniref:non-ribosomal peptide synthetase n=1 Tax=Dolichospermum sp. LEGE 00240 TaxID=1828603 RepID=UPI00187E9595|nr:non-ribosomal peptide synthetase [Dolichospermum sp. LEGE 00240]MBE9247906.1 amino acid adenylation domain-containing protein [Dolichospermum sp. LEGE 00240]